MAKAYVGLGSNLGDKEANLKLALKLMEKAHITIVKVSKFYVTEPYGVTDQPQFLNAAAEVEWAEGPEELLHTLLGIETDMGRQRMRHWGERNIDLDILFFEDRILQTEDLTVPHPDMLNRDFVLRPMAEIAPQFRHPVLHKTMQDIWSDFRFPQQQQQQAGPGLIIQQQQQQQ